jgi:hypothetical protein
MEKQALAVKELMRMRMVMMMRKEERDEGR